jgi:hypothetical protein
MCGTAVIADKPALNRNDLIYAQLRELTLFSIVNYME